MTAGLAVEVALIVQFSISEGSAKVVVVVQEVGESPTVVVNPLVNTMQVLVEGII